MTPAGTRPIAITGASGFIGRHVIQALRAANRPVRVADRQALSKPAVDNCEAVIHLAALAHRRGVSSADLQRVNVDLAASVGRAAAAASVPMLFVSSVKVHGEESGAPLMERSPLAPGDAYGESKARAEDALRAIPNLRLTVLRPPLVYGPGVRANFLALMRALARGWPLPFASIDNRRSFLYVGNLVDAILRALGTPGTFLVSDGPGVSTPDLCREIGHVLHRRARLFPFPPAMLPGRLARSLEVDDSALRTTLGWQPPSTREAGLAATAQWFRSV